MSDTPAEDEVGEQATAPDLRTAYVRGNTFSAKPVRYVEIDGDAVFEGDIVLGTVDQVEAESEQIKAELRGELPAAVLITGNQFRWPDCVVAYDIDPGLPNQARVTEAIAHWQERTNFTFVPRTPANAASYPNWVTFRQGSGCSSSVGMRGGQQFINLAAGCDRGRTIHEIGHAVGLWHEQSREDRDAFVTIHWQNIQPGTEHNFNQHITDGDDVGAYDYGSIMHYPRDAFGINGAETITPVDPNAQIGQRVALSAGDIAAANSMCPRIKLPVETIKELHPETFKERFPETAKELVPETIKELHPETFKERFPETIKELAPETFKEQVFETIREGIEGGTLQEGVNPFPDLGGVVVNPAVGRRLPFAMSTPSAATPTTSGDADARVAALEEAVQTLAANQQVLMAYLGLSPDQGA